MSTVADFNRIEDCDKIDSQCIDAFSSLTLDEDGILCVETSWDKQCIDLAQAVKDYESCTSLYLSPEDNPNCLVYEKEERCGDNDCIHGDDLSRIISMQYLKDVTQTGEEPEDGIVYMYNEQTHLFEPYDLKTTITNINTAIQNINQTLANHERRLQVIEEKLTPPADAPANVKVVFGNINDYSDPNVVINEGSGTVTTLDKTHGLYTHLLADNAYGDEIFG
ncbi:MAG: hypothetical protein U0L97_02195 [Candidatus Saccharimonadaceae bacterium]|nr:hypothetical protein [Candidatus Saccharimonadaceae bacterium]